MSRPPHPLIALLARLPSQACADSRKWLRGLPRTTTPAEAWAMAEDRWKAWLREQLRGTTDPVWVAIIAEVPDMAPTSEPVDYGHRRTVAPRQVSPDARERCFFARLAGSRRKVATRCKDCDGHGQDRWCFACDGGKVMVEALHPADEWTLVRLAEIPPMVTGARP